MSKIAINVDTETKDFIVNIDGQNVPNVCSVSIYESEGMDGEEGINISLMVCEDTENMSKTTSYFVKGSVNAKTESAIAGLCYGPEKVELDIANYFAQKRG